MTDEGNKVFGSMRIGREAKILEGNPATVRSVHHKSYMAFPGTEPGSQTIHTWNVNG
jgi:hypothetical protein